LKKTKTVVLTGGPCAGKTTLTEVLSKVFQNEVVVIPEAASMLFRAGFPRWEESECQKATQRAIYHVQIELEHSYRARYPDRTLILDRGTIDGAAYWPTGSKDYFKNVGTTLQKLLKRYDAVIYLESAPKSAYLANMASNVFRKETWEEAKLLDDQTLQLWKKHPKLFWIANRRSFHDKISEVVGILRAFA